MTNDPPEIWAVTAYEGCGCSGGSSIVGLYTTKAKAQFVRTEEINQRAADSEARAAKARAAGHHFVQPISLEKWEEHFTVEGPYNPDAETQDRVEPS